MQANRIPVAFLDDGTVILTDNLRYDLSGLCGVTCEITVPIGFISDGASIPRIFWSAVGHPFSPRCVRAAIVHDFICVEAGNQRQRRFGDTVFAMILDEDGVPVLRRYAMFWAVRMYGFWIWPIVRWLVSRGRKVRPE